MSEILDEATKRVTMLHTFYEILDELASKIKDLEQQKVAAAKEDQMKQSKQCFCL